MLIKNLVRAKIVLPIPVMLQLRHDAFLYRSKKSDKLEVL